jgi:hypothetical protein
MTGSRAAAERKNGEAGTVRSSLAVACRMTLLLALGACSIPAGPPPERDAGRRLPASLDGLDSQAVVALLGPPDLRRAEPPAELWQYRLAGCVLDIYLYRDTGAFHVVHAETRDRNPATAGTCDGTPMAARIRATRL